MDACDDPFAQRLDLDVGVGNGRARSDADAGLLRQATSYGGDELLGRSAARPGLRPVHRRRGRETCDPVLRGAHRLAAVITPSLPGLTRQSILFEKFSLDGYAGQARV